jgi:hypothetical protein
VVIEQTDPDLEVTRWGDIISFYNQVFVGRVKDFLLTLRERPKTEVDDENKGNASGSAEDGRAASVWIVFSSQKVAHHEPEHLRFAHAARTHYVDGIQPCDASNAQSIRHDW